jgi:hypothetical protein
MEASKTGKTRNGQDYILSARNIEIGNDCMLKSLAGNVNLELARIGGALTVDAQDLVSLNAKDAEVRGLVLVKGSVNNWKDEYWKEEYWKEGDEKKENDELRDEQPPGSLTFSGGNYGEFRIDINFLQLLDKAPSLSIEDARIERDLWVNKVSVKRFMRANWAKRSPKDFRAVAPRFYPDWTLVEALCLLGDEGKAGDRDVEKGREGIVAFLENRQGEPVLLSGKSWPIHQLNQSGALRLDSDESVLDYLRFFCAYVWGEEGAFSIIETQDALGGAEPSTPIELAPLVVENRSEKGWLCKGFIRYGKNLFRAKLIVTPKGEVDMTEDEPLAEFKRPAPVTFEPPLRVINPAYERSAHTAIFPFWLTLICQASPVAVEPPADVESTLRRLGAQVVQEAQLAGTAGSVEILLRGLKAGALKYQPSQSWGPGVQLKLEGFEYDRVEPESLTLTAASDFAKAEAGRSTVPWYRRRLKALPRKIVAADHVRWLSLQYADGAPRSEDDYTPQPYEQLARVLRNSGESEQAKHITLKKLSLERKLIHRWWAQPFLWIMEKFFAHGLFATRSLVIFFGLWLGGTAMFELANRGRVGSLAWPVLDSPVMVVDSEAVSPVLLSGATIGAGSGPAMQLTRNPGEVSTEAPCGDQVDSLWYALDVFVPLLDLKQEEKCAISSRTDAWLWRAFKSVYAVTGAIVTSLMLLTISGVLRRRVEQ